jgi:hypothetical protein
MGRIISEPTSRTNPLILNRPLDISTENLFIESVSILESQRGFVNFDLSFLGHSDFGTLAKKIDGCDDGEEMERIH